MKTAEGKTLVILSPGFPASESDTACLPTIQEFVLSLKEEFPDLSIMVIAFHYPFVRQSYSWNGIGVFAAGGRNLSKLARLLTWWRVWKELNKQRKKGMIGLLSLWYGECSLVGKGFSRRHGLKHFCWLQGQDVKEGNPYAALTRMRAGELIAMSDFLADEMERNHGMRPAHIIPNGMRELKNQNLKKDIDILGVGSLIPLKRWHLFVEAVKNAGNYHPEIRAMIAGSGIEKERLLKQIKKYGLERNITLTGGISNQEVLQLMQRSRILLHPSGYEGFGRVCIEALACGARVISFCRPIRRHIEGWQVVNTLGEMESILKAQLPCSDVPAAPLYPFDMKETARRIMGLYQAVDTRL